MVRRTAGCCGFPALQPVVSSGRVDHAMPASTPLSPAAGTWPLVNDTGACEHFSNLTLEARAAQLDAMRSVINLRLAPLRALSDGVVTAGLQQLLSASPEVYAVAAAAYGTDGQVPVEVSGSTLLFTWAVEHVCIAPGSFRAVPRLCASSTLNSAGFLAAAT